MNRNSIFLILIKKSINFNSLISRLPLKTEKKQQIRFNSIKIIKPKVMNKLTLKLMINPMIRLVKKIFNRFHEILLNV